MKFSVNSLIILLSASVIFAGCTKEERINSGKQEDKAIGIKSGVVGNNSTRALVEGNSLPESTYFGIYGYKDDETTVYTDTKSTNSLNNTKVDNVGSYVEEDWKIYWPKTFTSMKFHAYYPYQQDFTGGTTQGTIIAMTESKDGLSITYMANHTTNSQASQAVDLLYATQSHSIMPTNGEIVLDFKHILSRIDVVAKMTDETTAQTAALTVTKVVLNTTYRRGVFNGATGAWSNGTDADTYTINKSTVLDSDKTDFVSVADFIVIPFKNGTNNTATITYSLNGTTKTTTIQNTNFPDFAAEYGKRYVIEVAFTVLDKSVEVTFGKPSVTEWGNGGSTNVGEEIEI